MRLHDLELVTNWLESPIEDLTGTANTPNYQLIKDAIEKKTGVTIEQVVEMLREMQTAISELINEGSGGHLEG